MMKISIIMPLFNAEKYLEEAIQSILKQTYHEFEVICINDASSDGTLEILKRFRKIDKRILILENEIRSGAAISRNKGICQAKGKYIVFLDGDDIFDEELLEVAYKTIEAKDADIAIYEYEHVASEHIYEKRKKWRSNQYIEKYCRHTFTALECAPVEYVKWPASPCSEIFRRDFIISNKLEFQDLPSSNDVYFVKMALLIAKKIIMVNDDRIMVYARDHDVPTRISFDRDPMCAYLAMMKLGKELIARNLFSEMYDYFYYQAFFILIAAILKTKSKEKAELFYEFLRKKGIRELILLDVVCYEKADKHIKKMLEGFGTYTFLSGWYNENTVFSFCLEKQKKEILKALADIQKSDLKIALWGAGKNGNILYQFLIKNGIRISYVMDKSPEKQKRVLGEHVVDNPENVLDKVDIILFTSNKIFGEVSSELKNEKIELVNVCEIIGMNN